MMNKMKGGGDSGTMAAYYASILALGLPHYATYASFPSPLHQSGPREEGLVEWRHRSLAQSLTVLPPWASAPNHPGRASDSFFIIKSPRGLVCPGLSR